MRQGDKPPRWDRYRDLDDEGETWDERDESRPSKKEKRRHRDAEETDERRESERRRHPRQRPR